MTSVPTEVFDHLERHHGIISHAQLTELGCSRHDIRRLVRDGRLELVLQGAYRLRGHPLTELGRIVAVCTAHPTCAISGLTAGRLWGLRRLPAVARVAVGGQRIEPVHVLAPPHSQPTVVRWVTPYRTAAIHWTDDVQTRDDGVRLTGRARTALDLARHVDDVDLLSIIEQTMHDGGLSIDVLRRVAADWLSPRRPFVRRFLGALDRVLDGGPAESHPEVVLGDALARAGVRGIERQFGIDLPGYGLARFDLAIPQHRWAIEVDVFPTHRETSGRRRDELRDRAAVRLGWIVSRLEPSDVGAGLPSTVDRLVAMWHRLGGARHPPLADPRSGTTGWTSDTTG
ncbi:MAG: type IV toxin-antitoxin system AbiEi family antitoxin domain-containing protein [Actinomycetota bacterium]